MNQEFVNNFLRQVDSIDIHASDIDVRIRNCNKSLMMLRLLESAVVSKIFEIADREFQITLILRCAEKRKLQIEFSKTQN